MASDLNDHVIFLDMTAREIQSAAKAANMKMLLHEIVEVLRCRVADKANILLFGLLSEFTAALQLALLDIHCMQGAKGYYGE
ncbi:hypothetical protein CCACVL1_23159 [Corchorus capsularis]|uniref:Uncharacterized protein n=1 Tax=Corchorus capsularis TaxID=210143 RepID=A0A1R3GUV5_COCAP|nr:hypothetical protein CCACVL1_23159 [Corchorus capsularis]